MFSNSFHTEAGSFKRSRERRRNRPSQLKLHFNRLESSNESTSSPRSTSPSVSASSTSSSINSPQTQNRQQAQLSPRGGSPRSPRSPRFLQQHSIHRYFAMPPLSPIPPSPLPTSQASSSIQRSPLSPNESSILQRLGSDGSRLGSQRSLTNSRPSSPARLRSPSPLIPTSGNLALLASRRRQSVLAQSQNRRTSNFLELPVCDYEMRQQRRHCSLPERAYNPRHSPNEFYRLRSFSIKPNGGLVKHGDLIASRRRSRSSAGSTANTSR